MQELKCFSFFFQFFSYQKEEDCPFCKCPFLMDISYEFKCRSCPNEPQQPDGPLSIVVVLDRLSVDFLGLEKIRFQRVQHFDWLRYGRPLEFPICGKKKREKEYKKNKRPAAAADS